MVNGMGTRHSHWGVEYLWNDYFLAGMTDSPYNLRYMDAFHIVPLDNGTYRIEVQEEHTDDLQSKWDSKPYWSTSGASLSLRGDMAIHFSRHNDPRWKYECHEWQIEPHMTFEKDYVQTDFLANASGEVVIREFTQLKGLEVCETIKSSEVNHCQNSVDASIEMFGLKAAVGRQWGYDYSNEKTVAEKNTQTQIKTDKRTIRPHSIMIATSNYINIKLDGQTKMNVYHNETYIDRDLTSREIEAELSVPGIYVQWFQNTYIDKGFKVDFYNPYNPLK